MAGFTKLFSSIIASTIWREDNDTRIVWITMLAMKDRSHVVEASVPGLADMARVSVAACEAALKKLESPDSYSRTTTDDGRRIKRVDGGWLVLNGEAYRDKMTSQQRREYRRKWTANQRAIRKAREQSVNTVNSCEHVSVNKSVHTSSQVNNVDTLPEAEADPSSDTLKKEIQPACAVSKRAPSNKKKKDQHITAFMAMLPEELVELRDSWLAWIDHRYESRHPLSTQAAKLHLKKLASAAPKHRAGIIERSISSGWRDLFIDQDKRSGEARSNGGAAPPFKRKKMTPAEQEDFQKQLTEEMERSEQAALAAKRAQNDGA